MSQQQMPIVYPVYDRVPPPSNGSYGPVFIVLAAITAISVFACFLGRLCNKQGPDAPRPSPKGKEHAFQTKDGDTESESGHGKKPAGNSQVATATSEPGMHRPGPFIGRPKTVSFREPADSFDKPNKVQPESFSEPAMGRLDPFHKAESQGDEVLRLGGDHENQLNFKPRTRAQRY